MKIGYRYGNCAECGKYGRLRPLVNVRLDDVVGLTAAQVAEAGIPLDRPEGPLFCSDSNCSLLYHAKLGQYASVLLSYEGNFRIEIRVTPRDAEKVDRGWVDRTSRLVAQLVSPVLDKTSDHRCVQSAFVHCTIPGSTKFVAPVTGDES